MNVGAMYRKELIAAAPEETLEEAASRMQYEEVGSLAVVEHGELIGILTERDLTRAMADGGDPGAALVADYMSEEPVTVTADTEASAAAARMFELGVRHLPVLEGGRPVGMLSSRDLLVLEAVRGAR